VNLVRFFKCVGLAVLAKGLRALAGQVPFGEALWDIAEDACKRLNEKPEQEVRAEVEAVAQAYLTQVQQAVGTAVAEVAGRYSPTIQQALSAYLTQVPGAVRQSNKRPADPDGRTVATGRSFHDPQQVLTLLPPRLPRFKPGDRPLPGVNWELVDLLGVGGFGEVWKAYDPAFDSIPPVALKFCLDPEAKDRLLRHEAAVLNQVMRLAPHDGIVPLRKAYLDADPPCLECEYIGGGDLSVLVRDLKRLKPEARCVQARQIVQRLAAIVGHAHEQGIVHRDLKPANVLLQVGPGGEVERLRITDFGIGGVVAAQVILATKSGTARGDFLATALRGAHTPLYASPQQMRGEPPDPRDDVHALGVIWYQLLTGDLTTGASADFALELAVLGVPGETVTLLGRCLSARAERRPTTAAVLAREIAALPIAAAPSHPATTPPPQRRKTAVRQTRNQPGPHGDGWLESGDEPVHLVDPSGRPEVHPATQDSRRPMSPLPPPRADTGAGKPERRQQAIPVATKSWWKSSLAMAYQGHELKARVGLFWRLIVTYDGREVFRSAAVSGYGGARHGL
jgi:serine/threonine protein kinase